MGDLNQFSGAGAQHLASSSIKPDHHDHLFLINSHNNKAIRSGTYMCISDGEEDSGLEVGYRGTTSGMLGLSSDSESSSEDEGYDKNQQVYEHYNPDENEAADDNNIDIDKDDCKFGQPSKKHAITDILHNEIEIRPKIIDDFGGWDTTFHIKSSKPSKSNMRKFTKTHRTTSAFPRPSTEPKDISYRFKHHENISNYIKEYRENLIVRDIRLKLAPEEEEGLLIPDPYATKLKNNMCSIAENCDFLTVYSSSTKEKVENQPKEKETTKDKSPSLARPRPSSLVHCPTYDSDDEGDTTTKQMARLPPRPYSDHPFVVRTLSVKDRSKMLNLAPVRNQDKTDLKNNYKKPTLPDNMSLDHYLNIVLPHRQMQRKDSNLTASSLNTTCDKEEGNDKKKALHKKNIQLNIDGPCDPWTPKFEMKRSSSRGAGSPYKKTNSAGLCRQRTIITPDTTPSSKQWPCRPELTLSRANTYHTHVYSKNSSSDKELSINACTNRLNTPNMQRVYGQRFRCCERIHALLSSESAENEDAMKKTKDRHIKLSVDNMKVEKPNPVSFGSFGIRKGMRDDSSVTLSCMYKLKRERQRRFNLSLVK